ncbi:MAG: amidohydrolase family protein [Candidatus Korobacteraceae bacterium]|jgi:predicted TIM-barrel fold metal-dependent hydrolase
MQNSGWSRREFLIKASGVAGIAAITQVSFGASEPGIKVRYSAGSESPHFKVPSNATDCHHHIYDSQYPAALGATVFPPDASVADYRMLQQRLGISRHVIVQPSTYGTDNRLLVATLKTFGLKEARGIAVVGGDVTDAELKQLDAAGIRGVRFNVAQKGAGTTWEMMVPMAKRIEPLGWHIQLQSEGMDAFAHKTILQNLPCQIVFDHLAHVPEPEGIKSPVFGMVVDLLQKNKAWVKISSIYDQTNVGPPTYADAVMVAHEYVKAAPSRLVWATNWPHPQMKQDEKPDDAHLLDLLATKIAPEEETRDRLLVENPAKLYRF